jgi:2-oxoglutarate ferredoxin oxidoreductase subunit delta
MTTGDFVISITVNESKCTGCGTCVEQCPMGVYELVPFGRRKLSKVTKKDNCIACHTCELRCPDEAIIVLPPLGDELKDGKK